MSFLENRNVLLFWVYLPLEQSFYITALSLPSHMTYKLICWRSAPIPAGICWNCTPIGTRKPNGGSSNDNMSAGLSNVPFTTVWLGLDKD